MSTQRRLTDFNSSPLFWDDAFLRSEDPHALRRLMILDAANIMHATSKGDDKLSAVGLLTFMRYLLINQFDAQAVFSEKYLRNDVYKHFNITQQLIAADLAVVAPTNILDDRLCLEVARQTFGVVVSLDHFEDHFAVAGRSSASNQQRFKPEDADVCTFEVKSTRARGKNCAYTWSFNHHFVGENYFEFGSTDANKFFANPSDVRWTLAKDYRDNWSNKDRSRSVEVIDELIEAALGF